MLDHPADANAPKEAGRRHQADEKPGGAARRLLRWLKARRPLEKILLGLALPLAVALISHGLITSAKVPCKSDYTLSALPARAINETVGGPTHTWSNPLTAQGCAGSQIGYGTTVPVACRVTGYAVDDGDRWWYRLAGKLWHGRFFASADAFYNNGRTQGPLKGTPLVDPRVPIC
jgi:hypothetical protein